MAVNRERNRSFGWGLLVILILYCCYYLGFVYGVFMQIPLRARHLIRILFVLLVYFAGGRGLRKDMAGWMMKIWHLLYALGISGMLILGMYDWWVVRLPVTARYIGDSLQEFLVSPVLYIAIGLLRRSLARENGPGGPPQPGDG